MQKLSALVITYNEIDHIANCLASVAFADEIVVVDSFSTDGTWEFLKSQPNVKAVQKKFVDFTTQKAFALSLATHDWVYFLDADERVTPALKDEIVKTINAENPLDAYWNYRLFMFNNDRLRFSGWQTDKIQRLFKKSRCHFEKKRLVHETLVVNGSQGFLKEKLLHYSYKGFNDYKGKMQSYGRLRAAELFEKGKRWSVFHQFLRPLWKFVNHYFIRLGILDGKKGIIICYLNALGVWERYKELKKLQAR